MSGTTESSADSSETQPETSLPTESELHGLLSSETRRRLIDVLADTTASVDLRVVASSGTGNERVGGADDDVTNDVVVGLHHNHLPRLADAGIIQYDPKSNRIEAIHHTRLKRLLEDVT